MKIYFTLTLIFCLIGNFILGQTISSNKDSSFIKVRGNPDYYVDGIKVCCFDGEWNGKNIKIIINSDSTFSLIYFSHPNGYQTCGHWTKTLTEIILTDLQDRNSLIYELDCKSYTRQLKDTVVADSKQEFQKLAIKKNIWTVFDENNQIRLKVNGNEMYWTSKKTKLTRQKR